MRVKIELVGCDDSTEFNMKMTSEQYEFLNKIADIFKACLHGSLSDGAVLLAG